MQILDRVNHISSTAYRPRLGLGTTTLHRGGSRRGSQGGGHTHWWGGGGGGGRVILGLFVKPIFLEV